MSKAIVTIDIDDVKAAGGVEAAIIAACERSDSVSSGVVGMECSTSGPGPGWSKQHGPDEWSREAFNGGAIAYVDATDGRVRRSESVDDDTDDDDILTDIGGGEYVVGDWSEDSEVCVECPSEDDALTHPDVAAAMARTVIDYHHPMSDLAAWRSLVAKIKASAAAFDDIDADELTDDAE